MRTTAVARTAAAAAVTGLALGLSVTASAAPTATERAIAAATDAAQNARTQRQAPADDVRAQALIGTPGTLFDAIGDTFLAPDLQAMTVSATDDGMFAVLIRLNTNALVAGDSVFSWVNTDGNAATGSATFGGADVAVAVIGESGTDSVAFLRWNGSSWSLQPMPASLGSTASGGTDEFWAASLTDLGIAAGTTVTAEFSSMYEGAFDDYFDFAPEAGGAPLTYAVPAPPAPQPTAPAPAGGSTTPAPGGGVVVTATPALRINGLSASRAGRTLTVRVAWQGDTAKPNRYRLELRSRGTSKSISGAAVPGRALVKRVRLPLAWKGRVLQVRVALSDGSHRVTATRVVRG